LADYRWQPGDDMRLNPYTASIYFFCLIVPSIFSAKCFADDPDKVFGNMTYMIGNEYCAERASLVDGKYEVPGIMYVYYEGQYVYGDFNRDGARDAAVIIAESGGGSGHFLELAFLINEDGQFIHKTSKYLGDRVIINSLEEKDGKVLIDMFVHRENDCMAGPTKRVCDVYEYSGTTAWGPQ
jgi:hypothetical protein